MACRCSPPLDRRLTTKFAFNYNNKQGNDQSSYDQELIDLGVPVSIFQSTTVNQGIPTGVGNIFNEGGYGTMAIENSSYSVIRGDVTWFKQEGLGGSHEFQTASCSCRGTPTRVPASSSIPPGGRAIGETERPEQHELRRRSRSRAPS